jgi:hypothetical protein
MAFDDLSRDVRDERLLGNLDVGGTAFGSGGGERYTPWTCQPENEVNHDRVSCGWGWQRGFCLGLPPKFFGGLYPIATKQ